MDTEETGGGSNPEGGGRTLRRGTRQLDLFSLSLRKGRFFLLLKIKNAICNCNDSKSISKAFTGIYKL